MSLADSASDDDDLEAWLESSKKRIDEKQNQEKEKAKRLASQFDSMYEDEDDDPGFSNVRVMHDFDDLNEGKGTILTLADTDMTEDDQGYDVLVSGDIKEKEVLRRNERIRKGANKYNKYSGEDQGLLPQYNEEEGPKSFNLDISGNREKDSNDEEPEEEIQKKKYTQSAEMKMKLASDTYTRQEMLQFKKKRKKGKKKKRRRKRKNNLASELKRMNTGDTGQEDFSSREDRVERKKAVKLQEVVDTLEKRKRYNAAVQKVTVKAPDEDEEDELYESLQRAKKLAQKEKKKMG